MVDAIDKDKRNFLKGIGVTTAYFALKDLAHLVPESSSSSEEQTVVEEYGDFETEAIKKMCFRFLELDKRAFESNPPKLASEINQETNEPIKTDAVWTDVFYLKTFNTLAQKNSDFIPYSKKYASVLSGEDGALNSLKKTENHDIGLLGLALLETYKLTNEDNYLDKSRDAARVLVENIDPESGLIYWEKGTRPNMHLIDSSFMSVPLFWALRKTTGEEEYGNIGQRVLNSIIKYFIREDFTTCHMVEKTRDGYEKKETDPKQGYDKDSFWGRGVGWLILSCVIAAEENPQNTEFLGTASNLIDAVKSRCPIEASFPFDFGENVPDDLKAKYKDTSAQALIALSCLKLSRITMDNEEKSKYANYGRFLLKDLVDNHMNKYGGISDGNVGYFVIEQAEKGNLNAKPQLELNYADWATFEALLISNELKD